MSADFSAIKRTQQATWASGDYASIGIQIVLIAELLCEALDVRSGSLVLDVAAGTGNASLAAARRGCRVTSTDYVPALLEHGRTRAQAEGLQLTFAEADAEALPFADASFDAALSTVGVMFAPDQARAAAELFRVVRPGGRIGVASWTPAGFVGQMFRIISQYRQAPPGVAPPTLWGSEDHLHLLFPKAAQIEVTRRVFNMRAITPAAWLDSFRCFYGPMLQTYNALDEPSQAALTQDLLSLCASLNRSGDSTMILPSEYLEAVIHKPL